MNRGRAAKTAGLRASAVADPLTRLSQRHSRSESGAFAPWYAPRRGARHPARQMSATNMAASRMDFFGNGGRLSTTSVDNLVRKGRGRLRDEACRQARLAPTWAPWHALIAAIEACAKKSPATGWTSWTRRRGRGLGHMCLSWVYEARRLNLKRRLARRLLALGRRCIDWSHRTTRVGSNCGGERSSVADGAGAVKPHSFSAVARLRLPCCPCRSRIVTRPQTRER